MDRQVVMMQNFTWPKRAVESDQTTHCDEAAPSDSGCHGTSVCHGYLSDILDSEELDDINVDSTPDASHNLHGYSGPTTCPVSTGKLLVVPPLKHCQLEVPFHAQCKISAAERQVMQNKALEAIEKSLKSTKPVFAGGPQGLQAKWARAIQSHLALVIRKGHNTIQASKMAAECHGFAASWGRCQVRSWTRTWISQHTLPVSLTGRHAKVYSLLDDPEVAMELRTYVRSNKWAVIAQKLIDFSKNKLIPVEAEKYLHHVVQDEMPQGLKRYMDLVLFPRIHLKVGKGISLATAW